MRIRRLPAALVALEERCVSRLLSPTFHAELALIDSAALGTGPTRFRRFPFGLGLTAVHTEFPRIASLAAVAVPRIGRLGFRFLRAAVQAELAQVCRAALRAGFHSGHFSF